MVTVLPAAPSAGHVGGGTGSRSEQSVSGGGAAEHDPSHSTMPVFFAPQALAASHTAPRFPGTGGGGVNGTEHNKSH